LASQAIFKMRAELPSKSPTVGLNCASAIFIYNNRIRVGAALFNAGLGAGSRQHTLIER
jgi:hypothetical protein